MSHHNKLSQSRLNKENSVQESNKQGSTSSLTRAPTAPTSTIIKQQLQNSLRQEFGKRNTNNRSDIKDVANGIPKGS